MPKLNVPVPVPAGSKYCPDCSSVLPVAQFGVDLYRKDGLRTYCSPCAARRVAASKQRKKDADDAGRRMTAPHRVTPAQREDVARRFVEAMTETPEATATRVAKAVAAGASKPAKVPKPRRYPPGCCAMFPTPADARNWTAVCGNRG